MRRSVLRQSVPHIRTAGAIVSKYEQIQDALERSAITPKTAEQMSQTLKGIVGMAKLEMQYKALLVKFGRIAPIPRNPILRDSIGLPEHISPSDAQAIRAMITAS